MTGSFRFDHWLTRQVGYGALLRADARELHALTAQVQEAERAAESDEALRDRFVRGLARPSAPLCLEISAHRRAAGSSRRAALWDFAAASVSDADGSSDPISLARRAADDLAVEGDQLAAAAARAVLSRALCRNGRATDALAASDAARSADAPTALEELVRIRLSISRGAALEALGRLAEAEIELNAAMGAARAIADAGEEASAATTLANVRLEQCRFDEALPLFERALELRTAVNDEGGRAGSLIGLGNLATVAGDLSLAETRYREALAAAHRTGDHRRETYAAGSLGYIQFCRGNLDDAEASLRSAVVAHERLGDRTGTIVPLHNLGELALARGDAGAALTLQRRAEAVADESRQWQFRASLRLSIGATLSALERHDEALRILDESVAETGRTGAEIDTCAAVLARSNARARNGDVAGAAEDAARALEVARRTGSATQEMYAEIAQAFARRDRDAAGRASRLARRAGFPLPEAEALVVEAEIADERCDRTTARERANAAHEIASRCGLRPLVRRAEAILAAPPG